MSESMAPKSRQKYWIGLSGVLSFLTQLVIATVGAILVGMILVLPPALLIALLTERHDATLIDRVVDQPLFKLGVDNPYFGGPILTGFIFGWIGRRRFGSRTGAWVWVLPSLLLMWNMLTWKTYSPLSHWEDIKANFFTSQCGGSECLYELTVTAPFYTSVAYTLGWIARRFSRHDTLKV